MQNGDINFFTFPYPKNRPYDISQLNTTRGILVEIEGMDGSGKTTLVKNLVNRFGEKRKIVSTNFIHSTYLKDILLETKRNNCDPYTFLFMYLAGLSFTYSNFVIPNLKDNNIVILDRYIYTILLKSLLREIEIDYLYSIFSCFRQADIKFFIDTDINLCLMRKTNAPLTYWECGGNLYRSKEPDYLRFDYNIIDRQQAFISYQSLFRNTFFDKVYDTTWSILDGSMDSNDLTDHVWKEINEFIIKHRKH